MMEYFYFRIKKNTGRNLTEASENEEEKIKAPAFEGNPWL